MLLGVMKILISLLVLFFTNAFSSPHVIGSDFEGNFDNGKMHGMGREQDADGNVCEGEWASNQKTGKVRIAFTSGDVYEGDWINGEKIGSIVIHGKGRMKYANGDLYEGDWEQGQWHGKGMLTTANGYVSEGDFVNGDLRATGRLRPPWAFLWSRSCLIDVCMYSALVTIIFIIVLVVFEFVAVIWRSRPNHIEYCTLLISKLYIPNYRVLGKDRPPWAFLWSHSSEFVDDNFLDGLPSILIHACIHGTFYTILYVIVLIVFEEFVAVALRSCRDHIYYCTLLISKLYMIPIHRVLGKKYVTDTLAFHAANLHHTGVLKWLLNDIDTETEALNSVLVRIFICYTRQKPTQGMLHALEALISCNEHVEECFILLMHCDEFNFNRITKKAARKVLVRLRIWRRRKHFFLFLHGCRFWLFGPSGQTTKSWSQVLIGCLVSQKDHRPPHPIFYQEDICKVIASFL
jgi:hypothetical protein